jgi:hypothetical protein
MDVANSESMQTSSFPVITYKWTFLTKQSQEAYKRSYDVLSKAHVYIGVISRVTNKVSISDREDQASEAEETVNGLYDSLANELKLEDERLGVLLESRGIDSKADYSAPKEIAVAIRSPQDSRFLSLLSLLDTMVTKLDTLWLTGEMTNQQKVNASVIWKRRVIKTANRIIQLSRNMRSFANKAEDAKNAEDDDVVANDTKNTKVADIKSSKASKTKMKAKPTKENKEVVKATVEEPDANVAVVAAN